MKMVEDINQSNNTDYHIDAYKCKILCDNFNEEVKNYHKYVNNNINDLTNNLNKINNKLDKVLLYNQISVLAQHYYVNVVIDFNEFSKLVDEKGYEETKKIIIYELPKTDYKSSKNPYKDLILDEKNNIDMYISVRRYEHDLLREKNLVEYFIYAKKNNMQINHIKEDVNKVVDSREYQADRKNAPKAYVKRRVK